MSANDSNYQIDEPSAYSEDTYQTNEYRVFTQGVIEEFRANGGAVGGTLQGLPLLLLTTICAKSGQLPAW
jgi:hypothetical protein